VEETCSVNDCSTKDFYCSGHFKYKTTASLNKRQISKFSFVTNGMSGQNSSPYPEKRGMKVVLGNNPLLDSDRNSTEDLIRAKSSFPTEIFEKFRIHRAKLWNCKDFH
jgi:hypothetical protein